MKALPYFAQWESRRLVRDFLSGDVHHEDDPLWYLSGAENTLEYAQWSPHICGMACLKMLLSDRLGRSIPIISLSKCCLKYGGYVVGDGGVIKGLYYRPFVTFLAKEYGIEAEVKEYTAIEDIEPCLREGYVYMASVHPNIRNPETIPPRQGGHLVLVFGVDDARQELIFHNPSGCTTVSQENVHLKRQTFARFYAQRGILISPPA
jgi:hypothetical protein